MKCAVKQRLLRMLEVLRNNGSSREKETSGIAAKLSQMQKQTYKRKVCLWLCHYKAGCDFYSPFTLRRKISENQYLRLLQKDQRLTSKTLKPMLETLRLLRFDENFKLKLEAKKTVSATQMRKIQDALSCPKCKRDSYERKYSLLSAAVINRL
jgi:DNA topoisomerase-3